MAIIPSMIVRSLAGRDRGELFYVIGTEGVYALLANGRNRTVEHPKRKKLRHLEAVLQIETDVARCIATGKEVQNAQIRRDLAKVRQSLRSQNQGGQ